MKRGFPNCLPERLLWHSLGHLSEHDNHSRKLKQRYEYTGINEDIERTRFSKFANGGANGVFV
jgi:hypothetical protein